ncbi:MAG: ATP-dependent DNA helicase RecG [bacterium]|nr:ATP-dependent DNA helicase RecG [bacterium]
MKNLITLETKLSDIQGMGPKFIPKLKKLNIETVKDLLWHFPNRYEDYNAVRKISSLISGQRAVIKADVVKTNLYRIPHKRMTVFEAVARDESGSVVLVWFNQPYMQKTIREGCRACFAGKVFTSPKGSLSISNPNFEIIRSIVPSAGPGLVPIYPETRGLTSKGLRYIISPFLEATKLDKDFIPSEILKKYNLPEIVKAIRYIHAPKSKNQIEQAQLRFAFEYLFLIQLSNLLTRSALAKEKAPKLEIEKENLEELLSLLPFQLTGDQAKTLKEMVKDIAKPTPMNRLVQGDVGSGKTVVAALASIVAASNGYQSVFMAPTEVLARQHYKTFTKMFEHLDCGVGLLTASEQTIFHEKGLEEKKTKITIKKSIEDGKLKIIIGTHSLISSGSKTAQLKFPKLGLAVIDEQHRFGVEQRAKLSSSKNGSLLPHFLSMSATPIPRTLTLTIFGDLDLSTINELPKGRKQIITKIVDPKNRGKAYNFIRQNIEKGRQAFFIFPRIERTKSEEEEAESSWRGVKAVTEEYEKLAQEIFPEFKVGMLHGRLKADEKKAVMQEFVKGKIDILASTSVVEVGVDVPNATVMVIEGAERFGLSQLYQFRGRVGRGQHQSFCLLFTDSHTTTTHTRLSALVKAKNGFELAEKDLEMRGPGEFFGDKQTGMPDIAMEALTNISLVKKAQDSAKEILEKDPELKNHPELAKKLNSTSKRLHFE